MKYIIDKKLNLKNDAGFKARIDIINILEKEGYEYIPIGGFSGEKSSTIDKLKLILKTYRLNVNNGSTVLIQYPLNNTIIKNIIKKLKNKNCKLICLIHDIETLRGKMSQSKIKNEIDIFNKFDYIISHNEIMENWLLNNGVKSTIYNLQLFDYICENNIVHNTGIKDKYTISYATGKLGTIKSKFLCDIELLDNDVYNVILYGGIEDDLEKKIQKNKNIDYRGPISPDEITEKIEGDFGLIWDSEVIDKCNGNFGEYTKFNNPHKLSMYIASGIPVIAWEESAISNFIIQNEIGICVSSLEDIKTELSNLSSEKYNKMKKNIINISELVKKGEYIKTVLKKI